MSGVPKRAGVNDEQTLALGFAPAHEPKPAAAEFFAGIGLARLGLERAGFDVQWSNDIEPAKHRMYVANFPDAKDPLKYPVGDVRKVRGAQLPSNLALAWASSPCVDVSLAGARLGFEGERSATFFEFTRILSELDRSRPPVVTLENVVGLATSHSGKDLTAAIDALNDLGYSVDILVLDARWFVPQSRPRLFVVGALAPPTDTPGANPALRPPRLQHFFDNKSLKTHRFLLPDIEPKNISLSSIVERSDSEDVHWWEPRRVAAFEKELSPIQRARLEVLRAAPQLTHRTAYRRTRDGKPQWEVRSDDIAGCLRTARGGSSKQALVEVGNDDLRVRWMTRHEYARLMGADDYVIEDDVRDSQAIFGFGDAVCVPAVAWLAEHYLMPLYRNYVPSGQEELAGVGG